MTEPDWDDTRLAEAFHARFDRSAPPTVATAVHGAIAGTTPTRSHAFERFPARQFAAAAVVILLVGAVTVALTGIGRIGGGPSAPAGSGDVSTAGASATPTAQAIPGLVFESLPIIQVSDAIAIRDAGDDDRELAVQGWFTYVAASCPAPMVNPTNPLQVGCPDGFVWLMEQAESLVSRSGNQTTFGSPSGPALNPDLDGIDATWEFATQGLGASGDPMPTDVVFVGHFDDRRAALCPEAEQSACRDRFVVDSVASVAGIPQPLSVVRYASPISSVADIEAIIAEEAPLSPILSMVTSDGDDPRLIELEPTLSNGQRRLMKLPIVWVVRVLESERQVTYIVVDGTDKIYEMTPGGDAIQVGGTTGTPGVSPGPWPPDDAVVIALTSPVGAGEPVQVAVIDRSGRLVSVTEKGAVDPSTNSVDARFRAYPEPGTPGRVHLAWAGGICDSRVTVTVAADLGSITFDMGPQPANCDSIGVGRELVLDFDGTVDVPTIELRDAADDPSESEERGYELECGNLGPDTCQANASAIVAENLKRDPPRRVVSIRFSTGPCGGHTVTFDDGTIEAAMVDCIIPSPVAPSPAYQLDCGPLDPEACQTRAADIVAANLKRDPPKRVVSLTITSLCGSYSAIFDDGTGSSANILCIPR